MKNKVVLSFVIILVTFLLIACQSTTTTITNEVGDFIAENKLNYDEKGNSYSFEASRDSKKNKVVVCMEKVTEKAKLALEKEFGNLVEVEELECSISPAL